MRGRKRQRRKDEKKIISAVDAQLAKDAEKASTLSKKTSGSKKPRR